MIRQHSGSSTDNFIKQCLLKDIWVRKIKAVILLMLSQVAVAEQSSYEIHYLLVDTDLKGASYEPGALLYKHIVPYNSFINLEGVVALGLTEEKETRKVGIAGTYTQKLALSNMLGMFVNFTGELEPSVHAYVHAGLTRIEYDLSTPSWVGGPDGSQSETGLAYGIGMTFKILETGAFVLEFNQYPDIDTSGDTISTTILSLGYQMPF